MLKYQKAKAKLVEYDIPQKDYPKFPLNSNELSYPVVYILSRYAESVIENNIADMEEFSPHFVPLRNSAISFITKLISWMKLVCTYLMKVTCLMTEVEGPFTNC